MAMSKFIREQVIPAGMSVTAAAKELGVGRVALSNLLNGNSTLSQSMALKLERSFGADANDLLRWQAREDDALRSNLNGATRQPGGSILKITSTDIVHWADTIGARVTLPVLLRRLVHADIGSAGRIDFPGNDAGQRKGWDGFSDVPDGGIWVPKGKVGWELSSADRLPAKPESDMKQRSKLPASERAETTFVFVTARNWEGRHEWARKHRTSGGWHDVRAYDASDLEQWLEMSPTAQIWFAGEIGRTVDGAVPIGECWRHWSQSTSPEMSPILFEETVYERRASLHSWIDGDSERPFVVSADSADEALAFLAIALKEEDGTEGEHHDRAVFAATPDALAKVAAASRAASLEQALERLPMPVAFLRAAYFMENWTPMIQHAASEGILRSFLAPPQRSIPMVATSDIGSIAASVLQQEWRGQRIIDLAGPAGYSPMDVASCLSHQLGRGIDAISVPEGEWAAALAGAGFSEAALAGFVEMTRGLNNGHIDFKECDATECLRGETSLDQAIGTMAFGR